MAFSYYRNFPGWGTAPYAFGPPPRPIFVPELSWRGRDYFHAHCPDGDKDLYNHAWNSIYQYPAGEFGPGLELQEARHWHERAYGGLIALEEMEAQNIGHAAAYEAHRIWLHHQRAVFEPYMQSMEHQRESFIALAIAEASKIIQSIGRRVDSYERTRAAESAAATASRIFHETMETKSFYTAPVTPYFVGDSYYHHHHHQPGFIYIGPRDDTPPCCNI